MIYLVSYIFTVTCDEEIQFFATSHFQKLSEL